MINMRYFPRRGPSVTAKMFRCRRGVIGIVEVTVLCLCSWIVCESGWLARERQAAAILNRDYHTRLAVQPFMFPWRNKELSVDLRELRHGRFYVPITSINITNVTIDRRAWEQLVAFRYLEDLTFQDCHIEPAAAFCLANSSNLKDLSLWRTPITVKNLHEISRFRHLESLTLDGTGLKGDWLRPISTLPELQSFTLNDGDLSDGAADSLARMKGLATLQLSHVKIDSKLGPAIARLEKLEILAIVKMPFDDKGMKHLAGLTNLKVLYIVRTAITDGGMASLEKLLNLRRLSLGFTKVCDVGLRHLSKLPMLSELDIRHTGATNSCLRNLATIPLLNATLVEGTGISVTSPGFIGVLDKNIWYADEARAKEAKNPGADKGIVPE